MTSTNSLQNIHLFYRHVNYTHRSVDRGKALRSARHSLRIVPDKTKKLEWLPEFESANRIWLPSYGLLTFKRMAQRDRESLAQFIAPKSRLKNKTRWQKQLSNTKRKLKTALKNKQAHESS